MNRYIVKIILPVLAFALLIISAPREDSLFTEGNKQYEAQNYDAALDCYAKVEQTLSSPELFYNKGNALYRTGRIGPAILYFEKAKKLDPGNKDIAANIAFAQARITDRIPEGETGLISLIFQKVHQLVPLSVQLWLLFGFGLGIALFLSALFWVTPHTRVWFLYGSGLLALPFAAILLSAGLKISDELTLHPAVILEHTLDVVNQPEGRTVLFTLHEGTSCTIKSSESGWVLISLVNGVSGWVPEGALGRI